MCIVDFPGLAWQRRESVQSKVICKRHCILLCVMFHTSLLLLLLPLRRGLRHSMIQSSDAVSQRMFTVLTYCLVAIVFPAGHCASISVNSSPPSTPLATQHDAVVAMSIRILGEKTSSKIKFNLRPTPSHEGTDTFSFACVDGTLEINASSGTAAGAALHHYMREHMNSSVTWGANRTGHHIELPIATALPSAPLTAHSSLGQYRYHINACTYGYTMAFWQWAEWEAHLDWMALHGINLPLASEGAEYVWWRTYTELFNVSSDEVLQYFSGSGFLPWNRMGNIHSWGGPVSTTYLEDRAALQRQILQRMRDFGMSPVLPSFNGYVPGAIKAMFPYSTITRSHNWEGMGANFTENYLVDPSDPLFLLIAGAFMKVLTEEFGAAAFYSADTWNEMPPSSTNLDYIRRSATAVFNGVTSVNPSAVWVMQGWLFVDNVLFWTPSRIEAYLSGVPPANLLILDLTSEFFPQFKRTNGYFGYKFLWCMLHNYGGRRGLYGNVSLIASQPVLDYVAYPNMVGTGITMEAINQNEIVYELMLDVSWLGEPMTDSQLQGWMTRYARARYGSDASSSAVAAFIELVNSDGPMTHNVCLMHFTTLDDRPWIWSPGMAWVYYNADTVVSALQSVVPDVQHRNLSSPSASAFKYDAIDIARQFLSNVFTDYHRALVVLLEDYNSTTPEIISAYGVPMLQMVSDLDKLMLSDDNFLLGNWIAAARGTATSAAESTVFEFNARAQVTTWGPQGHLHDYAAKPWGSLLGDFTWGRWSFFLSSVAANFTTGHPFVLDAAKYVAEIYNEVELPFTLGTKKYPSRAVTDARAQILGIYSTYAQGNTATPMVNKTMAMAKAAMVAWHRNVDVLFNLCRLLPHCVAFSSDGTLFAAPGKLVDSPATLYMMEKSAMRR